MNELELLKYIKDNKINNIKNIEMELISQSTIRRRLHKLEDIGYIKLSYGGEIKLVDENKISIENSFKKDINNAEKIKIAKNAAKYIKDDDVIFIDNGTTVKFLFNYIKNKEVVIYTNGYKHIDYIKEKNFNIDIRLIPGKIRIKEASIVGEEAIKFINGLFFDICFIGANGYLNRVISTPNEDEKNIKQIVIENSEKKVVLIDKSKYGKNAKYKICNDHDVEIIS